MLTVKKFFCRAPDCPRKIFVERLDDFLEVSPRQTMRLRSSVQEIGFATCGKGGERLSHKLGLSVIAWLEAHPEVEIVSRGRGGTYIDGATQVFPWQLRSATAGICS